MNTIPSISIYNTLCRKKNIFHPIEPGKLGLYVCGMTVYDYCHLGHARVMAFFDTMTRYLKSNGWDVHYVRNITDIDDKILIRAAEQNKSFMDLTSEFITAMHEDFSALGFLPPDDEPKVTDYIAQIIDMIERLIEREYAYVTDQGDVYYRVKKFASYGQLSGKNTDDLLTGVRIEPDKNKESPLDFALWKSAKKEEVYWQSPWGQGRPGWHIECSAMSTSLLGNDFDVHGGGPDLVFPHHENEIAQSCGAYDCQYAHHWMHVAPLRVGGDKMSKSLGNFNTIRDLLTKYKPDNIRFFLARTHYRSPIQFDDSLIEEAGHALDRLYQSIDQLTLTDSPNTSICTDEQQQFHQAMRDDFNTPKAITVLFALAKKINSLKANDPKKATDIASLLVQLARSIGLMQKSSTQYFTELPNSSKNIDKATIEQMIEQRNKAKEQKNFDQADSLRLQLLEQGIIIEDRTDGCHWRRK